MSDVIIRDKAEYHTRTTEEMERHLAVPPWSLRNRSVQSSRLSPEIAREAHDDRLKSRAVAATFHYFARRVLKHEPEVLE